MAGSYAVTVEYEPACRRVTDRPRAAAPGIAWRRLIRIDADDDVTIRWWAAPGGGRHGPRRRR
jgi:hypothetical protein